jgi:hypothetical protein
MGCDETTAYTALGLGRELGLQRIEIELKGELLLGHYCCISLMKAARLAG